MKHPAQRPLGLSVIVGVAGLRCKPRSAHPLVTSVPCTSVSWQPGTRGGSPEGQVCFHADANGPFIYLPASLQRRGGAGLEKSTYPFSSLQKGQSSKRGQSKLQVGTHGRGLGDPIVEGGGGHCCQATSRGICIRPSSPLHPVTWVTATCSWASGSESGTA